MNAPLPPLPEMTAPKPSADWQAMSRRGYYVVFGALGAFVLWALLTRLDSAAIAPGVVSSESSRKTIQHLEGGIVQEILVRDGALVKANDVLIRLDPTRFDTQNDLFKNQFAISLAQEARLMAEFNGAAEITWPQEVLTRASEQAVAPVIADQKRLFESRRTALTRNLGIADSQIEQIRKEIQQSQNDIQTAQATLNQVQAEYDDLEPLYKRRLVPTTRMAPLERERLRLQGVVANGDIVITKLKERLTELELKRQQVQQDYRQEASIALVEVRKLLSDQRQQLLLTADLQRRAEIRAPISGTVQQMRVFTVGGVIRPGEQIMDIAPLGDDLVIRAKISPADIDRVAVGARAELKFSSLHYWGQGAVFGAIRSLSRDRITEEMTRESYFAAELVVDKATIPDEIRGKLVAGLPVEVIITTGERNVATYLLQPITDRLARSMRER
ncbi:MAG: HlyD family type I secretion periplasmic adaptor subunit [Proteobacteria bacterium]|nr:HlyD family type I secretion periplasmic adaptor subunit [Pseudomonadota bacterium]